MDKEKETIFELKYFWQTQKTLKEIKSIEKHNFFKKC